MAKSAKKKLAEHGSFGSKIITIEIAVLLLIVVVAILQHNYFKNKFFNQSYQISEVKEAGLEIPSPATSSKPVATPKATINLQPTVTPTIKPTSQPAIISLTPVNGLRAMNVPILMYHYIGNNPNPADTARYALSTAPDVFDQQMGILAKEGFTPITLDTLYAAMKGGQLPAKPIVLTFDDGYIDFYVNAFPILKKYNFHAVSFIPTSLVGTSYYMSWSDIKQIQASGLVAFEAHSLTHPDLTALSQPQMDDQVVESKKVLEAETGAKVNFFAYPYGTSNAATWQAVQAAGYFGGVGTWYGTTESAGNIFNMPRVRISGGISLADFASLI